MTKSELFLELAKPRGSKSRWVYVTEFKGKYEKLKFGNGGSWNRKESAFAKKYIVETDDDITPGNSIDRIRLNGLNSQESFNQYISPKIKKIYKDERCVMLGVKGTKGNTKIEIDHKNGRKDEVTQNPEDFQPLCKAANDAKREICKQCTKTHKRWKATNIKGNPRPFYKGTENYTDTLGCVGCYQYDPVAYRKSIAKKI